MRHTIRAAELDDCPALGSVHVRAWQHAYRSVMPDAYLDELRADDRAEMWRRRIGASAGRGLVVAEVDGAAVGFAAFGPERRAGPGSSRGELYALNVDPGHWGTGIGRALLAAATEELRAAGHAELVLWVASGNDRARRMYETEGWTPDGTTTHEVVLGVAVTLTRYRRTA